MRYAPVLAMMLLPLAATAGELRVGDAMVPLAPPTARVHAAYMTLSNPGPTPVQIVGVSAEGYAMAHLHRSVIEDGIASMHPVHQLDIAPGASVALEHGGLHVMLMRPQSPLPEGAAVSITLELADGTTLPVTATVTKQSHAHGS